MHDIGAHISFVRHHRHSYYLIKNGDLRGFHPDEIEVIALVARYHRRGTPKTIARGVRATCRASLRRTVRTLASILRVAESLDRSHAQVISGLEVRDRGNDLLVRLHTGGDAELEMWATASPPRAVREAGPQAGAPGDGRRHARRTSRNDERRRPAAPRNAGRRPAARNSGAPQDLRSYRRRSPSQPGSQRRRPELAAGRVTRI